jgi:C4-dicarboxylate transporter DctQ subunit
MKKMVLKSCRWISGHFEEIFMVSSLGAITISMFAQVISRYVFGAALVWTEELSRYCFILLAFAGVSYCIRESAHLRIDLLETVFPKLKKPLGVFTDICFTALCVYLINPALTSVEFIRASGQSTAALLLPTFIIYLPLTIALFLVLIRVIEKYLKYFLAYRKSKTMAKEA